MQVRHTGQADPDPYAGNVWMSASIQLNTFAAGLALAVLAAGWALVA